MGRSAGSHVTGAPAAGTGTQLGAGLSGWAAAVVAAVSPFLSLSRSASLSGLLLVPQADTASSAARATVTTRVRTAGILAAWRRHRFPPVHPFRFAVQTSTAADGAAW